MTMMGCQRPYAGDTSIYPARSLVFDAPETEQMAIRRPDPAPWFADRNDAQRAVIAGYIGPSSEQARTRTYDRQHHHAGRVYDNYWQYSVGERVIETFE